MNVNDIKKLVTIIQESDLSEFHYESEGTIIKISRKLDSGSATMIPANQGGGFPQGGFFAGIGSGYYPPMGGAWGGGIDLQTVQNLVPGFPSQAPSAGSESTVPTPATPVVNENLFTVECPVVGTFYRKPSPDASVFVSEGDRVKKGDTLCIVEAMKVMNEVDAPCDGIVTKVCVSDGAVVEFGEALFLIKP